MSAAIEVKYFNTFILKKVISDPGLGGGIPIYNGSFGIPKNLIGSYPVQNPILFPDQPENWVIEESRIRGGFNNTTVDFGAKAYLVEEEPAGYIRFNALIYSGIFNSRTGINDTNVFSTAQEITRATDPANGSIQKLYAEDTNLYVFQEFKTSQALIDKDAIFSAEGVGTVTSTNLVIGVIQPIPGKYGISQNPESFAVYGYNKYFSDKNNNVILKLQGSNIVEISQLGMRDYFRDELNNLDLGNTSGRVVGGWDIYNDQYIVSTQQVTVGRSATGSYNTVTFDEGVQGWTSFFNYKPDQIFSINNNLYTASENGLYKHYSTLVPRNQFYGVDYPSSITVIFNPEPLRSKTFSTITYEGSNGWGVSSLISDETGKDTNGNTTSYNFTTDSILPIASYYEGEYAYDANNNVIVRADYNLAPPNGFGTYDPAVPRFHAGFDRKENSYTANVINNAAPSSGEVLFGNFISGIKGYYTEATFVTDTTTDPGGVKTLFSVGSKFDSNNGY
jgi:hypothetical protein|tara:strand:+ start:4699 stop:6213 length:1515 start_codon:yes stop_codon:yes gene_type:complete